MNGHIATVLDPPFVRIVVPQRARTMEWITMHGLPPQESAAALKFLSTTTGRETTSPITKEQQTYLDFIRLKADALPISELRDLLTTPFYSSGLDDDHVFLILDAIAECANSESHFGIDRAKSYLVEKGIFVSDGDFDNKARNVVFICISWICLLYTPTQLQSKYCLQIDRKQTANIHDLHAATLSIEESKHPICEVIQQFGRLLPVKSPTSAERLPAMPQEIFAANTLYVSMLNAKTLLQIGGIKIRWINNISSHMVFDTDEAGNCSLAVFAIPSYCKVYKQHHTTLKSILNDYYDQYSRLECFSVESYLREILLSYRLLFGDGDGAHRVYRESVNEVMSSVGLHDRLLDEPWIPPSRNSRPPNSYSVSEDFPILGPRMLELQNYIQRQNSGTLRMLWHDRRDMLRWYTFWLVTIVGGITIVLAIASLAVAVGQLYYSVIAASQTQQA